MDESLEIFLIKTLGAKKKSESPRLTRALTELGIGAPLDESFDLVLPEAPPNHRDFWSMLYNNLAIFFGTEGKDDIVNDQSIFTIHCDSKQYGFTTLLFSLNGATLHVMALI